MNRRDFIALAAGAAVIGPRTASAQPAQKVYRLGSLTPGPAMGGKNPLRPVLLQALEQRGYAVGKNLIYDARGAAGQVGKLPEIVRSMKADNVDVIVTVGYPPAFACKVENVPTVVAYGSGDPVATHLVDGLARPGG